MLADDRAVKWRFTVLLLSCVTFLTAHADDGTRVRLAALTEQAELLLEELARLQPAIERLRTEGERLAASETTLTAELVSLEREIAAYNEAAGALIEAAQQHRARCPRQANDITLIEACNAAGADLIERYATLEQEHTELSARQQAVNQRVGRHNADRLVWVADKRDNGPRIDANESDANRWMGSARRLMLSNGFTALAKEAGSPPACTGLRLSDPAAYQGTQGLQSLSACLRAVQAALP
jgi:hypothetical protein